MGTMILICDQYGNEALYFNLKRVCRRINDPTTASEMIKASRVEPVFLRQVEIDLEPVRWPMRIVFINEKYWLDDLLIGQKTEDDIFVAENSHD